MNREAAGLPGGGASVQARDPQTRLAFLFPAFPVLHQTFVLYEVLALREHGIRQELYSLKRPGSGLQQPEAAALLPEVRYLPRATSAAAVAAWRRTLRERPGAIGAAVSRLVRAWREDARLDPPSRRRAGSQDALHLLSLRERVEVVYNTSPAFYLAKSLALLPVAAALGRDLRERGIRHLHAHWASYPATVALLAHWIHGIRFSFTAHAYDIYLVPRLLSAKVREAEFVITCAERNARYLHEAAGVPETHIVVNYHGVDLDRFQPRDGEPENEVPLLVTCGRLQLYKGHHILLQACALLSRPWRLVVIGEGPTRRRLERLAGELGIADRVRFTGGIPQSEVADWYRRADLFVLASVVVRRSGRQDVIPNVLAEAMASGVPVVATNVSGIPELVEDGRTGRLVPPNDPQELARAIDELLSDEEKRRALARAAVAFVRERFDRRRNVRELVPIFRRAETAAEAGP